MKTAYFLEGGTYETDYKDLHKFYLAGNDYISLPTLIELLEDAQKVLDALGEEAAFDKASLLSPLKFQYVANFAEYIESVSGCVPTPDELSGILYDLQLYIEGVLD